MGLQLGGLGLSGGATENSNSSTASKTSTYSGLQNSLQASLASVLEQLMPSVGSGTLSPNVQATETANANQINQNYSSLGDRMTKFLASRGFGKSGTTGKVAEQNELARQGALATNASNAAGTQLGLDQSYLSDALGFAFANPGYFSTGSSSGSSFGVGVGAGLTPAT